MRNKNNWPESFFVVAAPSSCPEQRRRNGASATRGRQHEMPQLYRKRPFSDHAEFRVLAAQYDQVQIIVWQPSWVMSPLFLRESDGQVVFVAAAPHAASSKRQWPMMCGKRHDPSVGLRTGKIVQLHQKGTSREGEVGAKFLVSRMDGGRGRTMFLV